MVDLLMRTNPYAAISYLLLSPPQVGTWLVGIPVWVCQVLFYMLLTALSLFLSYRRLKNVRNWI
jgi:hypothetical protein